MKTNKWVLALVTVSVSAGTAAHAQKAKTYMKSSNVPAYNLVKAKKTNEVPRLSIGAEREVTANIKPLNLPEAGQVNLSPIARKTSTSSGLRQDCSCR
jgi:hypothetical protein